MIEAISTAAGVVAQARVAADRTRAVMAEAEAARDHVKSRIDECQRERGQIVADRRAGVDSPKHGQRLALLEADSENLRDLLAETEADAAKAHTGSAEGPERDRGTLRRLLKRVVYGLGPRWLSEV